MISSVSIDPLIKVRSVQNLLVAPRTIRVTAFDEEAAEIFAKEMSLAHQTGQPIIPIVIDSYGGDLYSLWAMVEVIQAASVPIATIVEGKAMSCGALLFTCGTQGHRYIGPHSTLMLHDVASWEVGGKAEDIKVDSAEIDRLNRKVYSFIESNISKPKGYFWKMAQQRSRTDWYLTPREAVRLGFANKIGIPRLRTQVKVTITLGLVLATIQGLHRRERQSGQLDQPFPAIRAGGRQGHDLLREEAVPLVIRVIVIVLRSTPDFILAFPFGPDIRVYPVFRVFFCVWTIRVHGGLYTAAGVELRGIEPLLLRCERSVLTLALQPRRTIQDDSPAETNDFIVAETLSSQIRHHRNEPDVALDVGPCPVNPIQAGTRGAFLLPLSGALGEL